MEFGLIAATAADWPIVGQIAWVFGKLMDAIYNFLNLFGIQNIGICIILFTIIYLYIDDPADDQNSRKFFKKCSLTKRKAVDRYRGRVEGLFEENHVEVIYGKRHTAPGTYGGGRAGRGRPGIFEGKTVILAAGAVPMMNEIPGADLPGVWNSDRLLAAKSWNFDRLTIMGGGVIAVEFATLFNNLCSNVTIVEKKSISWPLWMM